MRHLTPPLLLLLILSVLLPLLIFSCDPDEAEKKKTTTTNTQDDKTIKLTKLTKATPVPIASLGTISDNANKDASGTGWVFQGQTIIFTATAKNTNNKEMANVQFKWAWRKRGKDWKELSSKTKTVTIPIKADQHRVGAYELKVSATSNGKTVDNSAELYQFTVRKNDCPKPDTANAPKNFTELQGMVTGVGALTDEKLRAIDTSLVADMNRLFSNNRIFNGKINCWDVSNVTNMQSTFSRASTFNQNIGDWDVSEVTNMNSLFTLAVNFNNDNNPSIGNWDVSKVKYMDNMFLISAAFDQDLSRWVVTQVTNRNNFALSANRAWTKQPDFSKSP